jgi:hypothetical protein
MDLVFFAEINLFSLSQIVKKLPKIIKLKFSNFLIQKNHKSGRRSQIEDWLKIYTKKIIFISVFLLV